MWDFIGFPRADGSVGIRNHILIIGVGPAATNTAYQAARMVDGATLVVADGDEASQPGELHVILRHPNVAGYVVIIEESLIRHVEDSPWEALTAELERTGKPHSLMIHRGSTVEMARRVEEAYTRLMIDQSEARRQLTRLAKLTPCISGLPLRLLSGELHHLVRAVLEGNGCILWAYEEEKEPIELPAYLEKYSRGRLDGEEASRLFPGLYTVVRSPRRRTLIRTLLASGVHLVLRPAGDEFSLLHPLIPEVFLQTGTAEGPNQGENRDISLEDAGLLTLNAILASASGRLTHHEISGKVVII